jgi:hypothetical protein
VNPIFDEREKCGELYFLFCTFHSGFQEHMRYIRNNNPQSACGEHILQNQHEYGTMDNTMKLLKLLKNNTVLIPYEQLFIQSLHQEGKLIAEQHASEPNLLFQLVIDPFHTPHDKTSR